MTFVSTRDLVLRDAYIAWAEQTRWRWVGVLTFRDGFRTRRARSLLLSWLNEIETNEGHPISFFAVREFGGESDHLHYHILLAGIGSRLKLYWPRWEKIAGIPKLGVFRSSMVHTTPQGLLQSSGVAYALKSLGTKEADFEAQLHPEHLLPKFRRLHAAGALVHPSQFENK